MEDYTPPVIKEKRHNLLARCRIGLAVRKALMFPARASTAFERFARSIEGEMPFPGDGGVILASCDEYYYWYYARSFVWSIDRQARPERIHLHICTTADGVKRDVAALVQSCRHVRLTVTFDPCLLAAELAYPTVYYAVARFLVAPLVLEKARSPLLILDVDGLANQPVWERYDGFRKADVLLFKRPEMKRAWRKILACAIGYENTPGGQRLAMAMAKASADSLTIGPVYHIDQMIMHLVSRDLERRGRTSVGEMPKTFMDDEFAADSVIWTPRGWTRRESSTYNALKSVLDSDLPPLVAADGGTRANGPALS